MQTDVSLIQPGHRIVVDTKFYRRALQRHCLGRPTVRSAHLYRLFAYMTNLAELHPGERIDAILLYPAVGRRLCLSYDVHGHAVLVRTIDLGRGWQDIRDDLLRLIQIQRA